MKASFLARHGGAIWGSRLVRSLAGQWGTTGDPTVMRCMGQFVPLTAPGPRARVTDGTDQLLSWTESGQLTYGEAEVLLALDESTAWHA